MVADGNRPSVMGDGSAAFVSRIPSLSKIPVPRTGGQEGVEDPPTSNGCISRLRPPQLHAPHGGPHPRAERLTTGTRPCPGAGGPGPVTKLPAPGAGEHTDVGEDPPSPDENVSPNAGAAGREGPKLRPPRLVTVPRGLGEPGSKDQRTLIVDEVPIDSSPPPPEHILSPKHKAPYFLKLDPSSQDVERCLTLGPTEAPGLDDPGGGGEAAASPPPGLLSATREGVSEAREGGEGHPLTHHQQQLDHQANQPTSQ